MELSPGAIGALLLVSIVLSIGAIAAGVSAKQGEKRIRAIYSRFAQGRKEDVVTLLELHLQEIARLQAEVKRQQAYGRQLRALLGRAISRVGTVRYDAFDDMGGRLSFSMALLDEHGDGSVITAMNGRVQTRTYAKPVTRGSSTHNLSEEEVQAITQAMDDGGRRAAEATAGLPSPAEVAQHELVVRTGQASEAGQAGASPDDPGGYGAAPAADAQGVPGPDGAADRSADFRQV